MIISNEAAEEIIGLLRQAIEQVKREEKMMTNTELAEKLEKMARHGEVEPRQIILREAAERLRQEDECICDKLKPGEEKTCPEHGLVRMGYPG